MASDRGLPTVPRGLDRDLQFFLQNLLDVVGRMSGLTPGSISTRAVRYSETTIYRTGGGSGSGGSSTPANSIITNYIQDGAVTTTKIAPLAVDASRIADDSIQTRHIVNAAVTSDKIGVGAVGSTQLADEAVTTGRIASGAVVGDKILNAAVTTDKIEDGAVTRPKIADSAVNTEKMADGSVTTEKIAHRAITAIKIADGVLPQMPAFAAGTVTDGDIVVLPIAYQSRPYVAISRFTVPASWTPGDDVGVTNLEQVLDGDGEPTGMWQFTAAGMFDWFAIGYEKRQTEEEAPVEGG